MAMDKFTSTGATLVGLYAAKTQMTVPAMKDLFHRSGKQFLKELARRIGATEFEVRSNKAGPAVVGEVTLHTPHVYVQLTGGSCGDVMFRSVNGMKDYTGGPNQWSSMREFLDGNTVMRIERIQNGAFA